MLPVIEVQCPFCKATGQIMTPPMGSIIVGPCPRCNETVLLFDGSVMALDKNIISDGTPEEKKQHLLETIVNMVAEKVEELVDNNDLEMDSELDAHDDEAYMIGKGLTPSVCNKDAPKISREDVRDFVNIDLNLIDSKNYFEKVFRKKKKSEQ